MFEVTVTLDDLEQLVQCDVGTRLHRLLRAIRRSEENCVPTVTLRRAENRYVARFAEVDDVVIGCLQ